MIDNSLLRKALTIWGIENQECELIAFRENLTYKTFNNVGTFAYFSSITGATGSISVTTNAQPCVGYGCTGN